jgi:hypothetical protein
MYVLDFFSIAHRIQLQRETTSNRASTPAQKVDNKNYQGHHEEQMDKPSADVEAEAQKPQNSQNHKNRPKHIFLLEDQLLCPSLKSLSYTGTTPVCARNARNTVQDCSTSTARYSLALHNTLSNFPHSRHDDLDREVIRPQNGHILCDPKPAISAFSLAAPMDAVKVFHQ